MESNLKTVIKKNRANSQKYITIPSEHSLQEGDNVEVTKIESGKESNE